MDKMFKRTHVNLATLEQKNESGIYVKDAIKLIEGSKYFEELKEALRIDEIINDYIDIQGASKLFEDLMKKSNEFSKIDINAYLKDISIDKYNDDEEKSINFSVNNIENGEYIETITAKSIYSAKSTFFNEMFSMNKFSNFCSEKNCTSLVSYNVDYLKKILGNEDSLQRRYRILKDNSGNYYLRTLTSTSKYFDYNLNVSAFIALVIIHLLSKDSEKKFKVKNYIYNESYLSAYFELDEYTEIDENSYASFMLELSNDELKKESIRLSGVYNIYVKHDNKTNNFYVKPECTKLDVFSASHSLSPGKIPARLAETPDIVMKVQKEMLSDILSISKIKNLDQIRHLIASKVNNKKTDDLKKYKEPLMSELGNEVNKVNNVYELLKLMGKLYIIIQYADISAKEYLMYILYDSIHSKKDEVVNE